MSAPRRSQSLFWSIAGVLLVTSIVAILLQLVIAFGILRPIEANESRARAEIVTNALARDIAIADLEPGAVEVDTLLVHRRLTLGPRPAWLVYRDTTGNIVVAPSTRANWLRPLLSPFGAPVTVRDSVGSSGEPRHLELVAQELVRRRGQVIGEVLAIQPERSEGPLSILLAPPTLTQIALAILLAACMGLFLVRMLVRRLHGIRLLAEKVADGDLSVRIGDTTGDEIGQLASQLDQMTERLKEARDHIAEVDFQRRQLFADITHELATPLTSIRANAETLLDPGVPLDASERTRYVQGVLDEAQRLDRLIRDLFDLARLEAGASPLSLERLDWAALNLNTVERFRPRFEREHLKLTWESALADAWIEADGHRMEQVLDNLLGNALHYVPEGGHVRVRLTARSAAPQAYVLEVCDDGPGVPHSELPRIFERFFRAADARGNGSEHEAGGTGLGLAIVREIVQRHGGKVSASAARPTGLCIHVELAGSAAKP